MPRVALVEVTPVGKRKALCFASGEGTCRGLVEVEVDQFPEATMSMGQEFREERIFLGVTLGAAARALDVPLTDLSGIEQGRLIFASETEALVAYSLLESVAIDCKERT
jgi:hypothetical protein